MVAKVVDHSTKDETRYHFVRLTSANELASGQYANDLVTDKGLTAMADLVWHCI
jgi:hypothetical protein